MVLIYVAGLVCALLSVLFTRRRQRKPAPFRPPLPTDIDLNPAPVSFQPVEGSHYTGAPLMGQAGSLSVLLGPTGPVVVPDADTLGERAARRLLARRSGSCDLCPSWSTWDASAFGFWSTNIWLAMATGLTAMAAFFLDDPTGRVFLLGVTTVSALLWLVTG